MKANFELISIGNELLSGKTLNTNAHWLAKKITELGGFVRRCTVIRDDLEEIASTIKEAMARRTGWIIISGGLGPTYDDKTLQGVATAVGRGLKVHDDALKMMKEKYEKLRKLKVIERVELTPARIKMATLPVGATPLPNPIGSAPGVLLREEETSIICLPGVPAEMEGIFAESVAPVIKEGIKGAFYHERSVHISGIIESDLAPIIEEVLSSHPFVYVKSHPRGIEEGVSRIEIQVTATAEDATIVERGVEAAIAQLISMLTRRGVKVEESEHKAGVS